jgi:signal peptidase I
MELCTLSNDKYFKEVKRLVRSGYAVRMKVRGSSMSPLIVNDRDDLVVSPCEPLLVSRGDIILAHAYAYIKGKRSKYPIYILHRVIKVQKSNSCMDANCNKVYILRGDGNCKGKEICSDRDIIGSVSSIIRYPNNHPEGANIANDSYTWWIFFTIWEMLFPFRRLLLHIFSKVFK